MTVYFISGLGADERVFAKLKLPPGCRAQYIHWIPFEKGESLRSYSRRLAAVIDTSQPFSIVGLSLGGMIVSEMAEFLQPVKTVLISSAPTHQQLPFYFAFTKWTRVYKWVPMHWYLKVKPVLYWFSGVETKEDKQMFDAVIADEDYVFLERATEAVLYWKKGEISKPYFHIHGTKDRIIPIRFVEPTHVIAGGSHLMVYNKAEEVSEVLGRVLGSEF